MDRVLVVSGAMSLDTRVLDAAFFDRDVIDLARALIGATLLVDGVGGLIVETEAYRRDDPASHSFRGPGRRNATMFGPPGRAYVYRSYGMHWCFNIVAGAPGEAVLVRALEPVAGLDVMAARRGVDGLRLLCAGPGRLCQALGLDARHDGLGVGAAPFRLHAPRGAQRLVAGPRIGITRAVEQAWRFGLAGSRFHSRRFPDGAL
jgi:DNA-3-methyladenine glycosylase